MYNNYETITDHECHIVYSLIIIVTYSHGNFGSLCRLLHTIMIYISLY